MDIMSHIVPLNIIYPETNPRGGEIPQATDSDVESNDDQIITRKRKTNSSGRVHDVGESPSTPHSKKMKLTFSLDSLTRVWRLIIMKVHQILTEHIVSKKQNNVERRSTKLALKFPSAERGINEQRSNFQRFNNLATKRKRISELNDRINWKKFESFLAR